MAATAGTTGLTSQQTAALSTRDVSVALSAGAGCGKTFVLTERFLSHLDEAGADELGRYVAITFTDRAAREMRDRIRRGCEARLQACDDDSAGHWLGILRELDSARVSTIHAFCGSLLRAHAVEAGLDPRFQTLDAMLSATLRTEYLDDKLRELLSQRDRTTMDLVVQFGLERLKEMIGLLLNRRQQIDFAAWQHTTVDEVLARWAGFHAEQVVPATLLQLRDSAAARALLRILSQGDICRNKVFCQRQQVLRELLPRLAESTQPAEDLNVLRENAGVKGAGGARDWQDENQYADFRDAATELRKLIDKLAPRLTFDSSLARPAAAAGLQLLELTRPIVEGFQNARLELNCLDFDDLLIRARDLLLHPDQSELRRRLSAQIKLLLVDESQDTDPLQVELIAALCGDGLTTGKLFFVGDFKQSIYRFRRADPRVFRELQERMPAAGRLPLSRNFRSQPAILYFVNALFCDHFGAQYEPLVAHRTQLTPEPAIEFLWYEARDEDEARQVDLLRGKEADWIARRLRAMIDGSQMPNAECRLPNDSISDSPSEQGESTRAVRPGDIAILFRAMSNVAEYEEALRSHDIPYYVVGGKAFYAQQEIFDLLNLLRSLASPGDVVSLAGALRSPFFSLADETIFWLAQQPGGLSGGLFSKSLHPSVDPEQARRANFAAETLRTLRSMKDRLPIADLIHEALARTGYDAVLLAEFLGERKLANLHKLIEQARGFDRSGIFTLADFITQLSEFVAEQPDEALAATHPESTNVVRLMSIHQSKGLEFPVVVVADLDRRLHHNSSPAAFDRQLGALVRVSDDTGQDDSTVITGYDLHAALETQEEAEERIRLLYVAATRAADYLLLSAGVKKLDAPGSPWMQLLAERFDLKTGRFLGTLPPGYESPGPIRVTLQEPPAPAAQKTSRRRSLTEIVEQAASMARTGQAMVPPHIGPIPPDPAARRQFSFSRLSEAGEDTALFDLQFPQPADDLWLPPRSALPHQDAALRRPDPEIDPLRLGTLVHEALAVASFQQPPDIAYLLEEISGRRQGDTPAELACAVDLLDRFFRSERAESLRKAKRLYRELEFLLAWPVEAGMDVPSRSGVTAHSLAAEAAPPFLQGFIDCLSEDAQGDLHLLDYKTNHVDEGNILETARGYELQLQVYALAVEQTFGRRPVSRVLHFLRTGREVHVPQAPAAALRQEIDRRMAALWRAEVE